MIKASNDLQDLRRRIYVKAKAETTWRFWGLYVHVCRFAWLWRPQASSSSTRTGEGPECVSGDRLKSKPTNKRLCALK